MAKTELEHVPKNYQGVAMSSASIAKTRMIHCEPEDSCFRVERDDAELQEQNCQSLRSNILPGLLPANAHVLDRCDIQPALPTTHVL